MKTLSAARCAALGYAFVATGTFAQPAPVTVTSVQLGQSGISIVNIGSQNLKLQEMNISWSRPLIKAGGQPLPAAELASYKIYMLNDGVQDYRVKTIASKYLSTKIKQPLCTTAYYAMTALDSEKNESLLSSVVTVKAYCPQT